MALVKRYQGECMSTNTKGYKYAVIWLEKSSR